jgi:cyanophycinase
MEPRGKIIITGDGINHLHINTIEGQNFSYRNIFKRIVMESAQSIQSRIEIITTASNTPEKTGNEYQDAFFQSGAFNTGILHIKDHREAQNPEIIQRLKNAHVLVFTEGNPLKLSSILVGTAFHETLLLKYMEEDFLFACTSAGVAAVSGKMLHNTNDRKKTENNVRVTSGLGLIHDVMIDTHYIEKNKMGQLLQVIVSNPQIIGVGLSKDAGLLITEGKVMEVITGLIVLIDGRRTVKNNMDTKIVPVHQICIHIMSKNDVYDLQKQSLEIHPFSNTPQFLN